MAFGVIPREQPAFVLVSEYAVRRLGKFPSVRISYEECVYLTRDPWTVSHLAESTQISGDDVIVIPGAVGTSALTGGLLVDPTGATVGGSVLSWQHVELSPAIFEEGIEVTPAQYVTAVYMATALSQVPATVALVERVPTGTPGYRRAQSGRPWNVLLDGSNPTHMTRLASMMGTAYFIAVKQALLVLGLEATDQQIGAAVQTLAAQGITIDGLLSQQAEQLEIERRAGQTPWLITNGTAP